MYRMARTAAKSGRLMPNLVPAWGHLKGFHRHQRLNFNVCMKILFGLVVLNITTIFRYSFPGSLLARLTRSCIAQSEYAAKISSTSCENKGTPYL